MKSSILKITKNIKVQILQYSLALGLLLFLLRWLELRWLIFSHSMEVFTGLIAMIFTGLGIWLAIRLRKPKVETVTVEKHVFIEKEQDFQLNSEAIETLNISKRELEVLKLMSKGLSNEEIASQLFISLPTVKTHASNIFSKLNVKRRTQAVDEARKLDIIQ